ncbi:bidirectional sugar transporter N3-like [Andrographis paniculata]|uniref:bidirectional sugar transporter N3-like n=1 Tax=Andrographis paniculata TaxID=175694 RepID=UPI0021E7532E|nr:bidirectional sugar transporter N3-like [Andrographis paniculata]
MAHIITHSSLVFIFGILGNLVAFMVYLAPVPTFYSIYKKKTTGGFHSVPYIVALLSSMLWIYYATLKSNEILLITINSFGCFIEAIYIFIYISYAPKLARMVALKMLFLINFVGFGLILVFTHYFVKGSQQVQVLGWISVVLSISVYIAPLSIMSRVIRTKSVEFMPVALSIALLFNAVMWFFYGLLLKDFFVAVPNVVGVIFGVVQIILYLIYRNGKANSEDKLPVTAVKPNCEIHPW